MKEITDIEIIKALLSDYKVDYVEVKYSCDFGDTHSFIAFNEVELEAKLKRITKLISFTEIYHKNKEISVGDIVWCKDYPDGCEVITDSFLLRNTKNDVEFYAPLEDLTLIKKASEL